MKIALLVTHCVAALVAVTAISTSHAFDRSGGGRYIRDFDRDGGNHYILCFHCEEAASADVPIGLPNGITTDNAGNIYFSSVNIVYKLDPLGNLIRFAGDGTPGYSGDGGPAVDARLNIPLDNYPEIEKDFIDYVPLVGGLTVDASGTLYIADAYNNRIRKVGTDGIITTVAGPGIVRWPQGVAVDLGGNLYVSTGWGPLNKISPDGNVTTLAIANCGPGFGNPGFCVPEQIALDRTGNVYVPDGYCRVRKVSADGSTATVAGDERPDPPSWAFTCGYSGDGGPAVPAALSNMPYGVAVDSDGNLFIADTYNHCVRKVDGAGLISTVAGHCLSAGYSGDGGTATGARLNTPMGVAVDVAGNLYIADTENHRIRKVDLHGTITTVAGNGEL